MTFSTIITLILIGLIAGILSGLIGIGGGIIVVPALVFFLGLTQHSAQGTSLAMMLPPIGALAVYNYYKAGNTNLIYAFILALCFFIGGYLGSKLSIEFINEQWMKRIFGIILFIIAIKMIFFSR